MTGSFLGLAMLNDATWITIAAQVGPANALLTFDADGPGPQPERLIIAGGFASVDGVSAARIAAFDGSTWEPLGAGLGGGSVITLSTFDFDGDGPAAPELLAGGAISQAGGAEAIGIARWNGSTWSAMPGLAPSSMVTDIAAYDPDAGGPLPRQLVIAGDLTIDGVACHVARWDGQTWEPIPGAPSAADLAVLDSGNGDTPLLVAAVRAGAQPPLIHVWNGTAWSPLGENLGGTVTEMTTFDFDGPGPAPARVVVTGSLSLPGGISPRAVAWDGAGWVPITAGSSWPTHLAVLDPDGPGPEPRALFASDSSARRVLRWGCLSACPADWDGNDAVNSSDISAFLASWHQAIQNGGLAADFNSDLRVNSADISAFLSAWIFAAVNGC